MPLPLTATHPTRGVARPTRLPPDARDIELVLVGEGGAGQRARIEIPAHPEHP